MIRKAVSKEKERMQTRCLILKTLLGLGEASKQKLHEKLKEKIKSRATVGARVTELVDEDCIRIEIGPRGPRGTHNCSLTLKGLAYLLLECNLEGKELEITLTKLLSSKKLKDLSPFANIVKEFGVTQVIAQSLSELRAKVNLKYFDEEWFEQLLKDFFEMFSLQYFLKMSKDKQVSVTRTTDKAIKRLQMKYPGTKKYLLELSNFRIKNAQGTIRQKKREIKRYRRVRHYAKNL